MAGTGRLRKREIALAVAAGALAAGGAALILERSEAPVPSAIAGPSEISYALAPFAEISSVGPQDVVVTYGEGFSVRAEGDPERLARLEAVVDGDTLAIRPRDGIAGGFELTNGSSVTFYVTVPALKALSLLGTGDAEVDRIEGDRFEASIRGPGELSIGAMRVDRAGFSIAGSGGIEAAGTAGDTRVSIAGSGELDARDLTSRTAWVSLTGSGDASLTVEEQAQVSIRGSGDVDIAGSARCTVSRIGSGDVRCGTGGD